VNRLNLVSGSVDRELGAIRRTIATFEAISALEDVIGVLRAYSERGNDVEIVDAIGHSRRHGFLVLGTWVLDDSPQTAATFSLLLRPSLKRLGVHTIRLLGCSTATTERGCNAMRKIARVTGCEVLGTKRYVSEQDYGDVGLISEHAIVDAEGRGRSAAIESSSSRAPRVDKIIRLRSEIRARST